MSHYPISAYRQLFPDGKEFAPFDPAEDGDHYQPEPNFFEWWYFDVTFKDGSYLVAIFHSSLYNAVDHKPTLDLRYYPPEGSPIVAIGRFDRTAYRSAPDRCQVSIDDCQATDCGDHYRLKLRHGSLDAELSFWPQLPGWRAGTGHLFADSVSGHFFDWVVPLPRARVEGTLSVEGKTRDVAGIGYHDHNWGNFYLPAAFERWTWGRVLAGEWTVIFGDVVGRGKTSPHVTPFMLARGDEILLATDRIQVHGQESAREPRTGAGYFCRLRMTTQQEPGVELTLTNHRAIDALDFAAPRRLLARQRHSRGAAEIAFYLAQAVPGAGRLAAWLLGKGSYVRWEADYHLNLAAWGSVESGRALYEMMLL